MDEIFGVPGFKDHGTNLPYILIKKLRFVECGGIHL
jgi:hypothetical protein